MRGPLTLRHGLNLSQVDKRTFSLCSYLQPQILPRAPRVVDWGSRVRKRFMWGNAKAGTCVLAAVLNYVAQVIANAGGAMPLVSDEDVIGLYSRLTGYDPVTGANDRGLQIIDVLKLWRNEGIFGHRITGFMQVNAEDWWEVSSAHWIFGGTLGAYALPRISETQFRNGERWDLLSFPWGPARPGSWGYHAMTTTANDLDGWGLATWMDVQRATQRWMEEYTAELWVVVTPEWIAGNHESPSGFDYEELVADLGRL